MILIFLIFFSISISENHSLIPPFSYSNINEINDWTIRGSAINMKSFLRLTNSIINDFGGVCNRIPILFHDWVIEYEILAKDGNSGEGFHFIFSQECCPDIDSKFNGIRISINTEQTNESNYSPVYYFNSFNQNNDVYIGDVYLKPLKHPLKVRVTHNNSSLKVEYMFNNSFKTIYIGDSENIIYYGYISYYASTSANHYDNNDLYSLIVFPLSESISNSKIDYSSVNRKIIQDNVLARRVMKNNRRSKLITSNKYREQLEHENSILSENIMDCDLKDAFQIIKESEDRGKQAVSLQTLKDFIESKVDLTINKAQRKIDLASLRLNETKLDMDDVWSYLKVQLINLSNETGKLLKQMRADALQIVNEIKFENINFILQHTNYTTIYSDSSNLNHESNISFMLMITCFIEFIGYIVFFIIQHQKTNGFNKID